MDDLVDKLDVFKLSQHSLCVLLSKIKNINIIYIIECNVSNRVYVGSTELSLEDRMKRHKSKSNSCRSNIIINENNYTYRVLEYYTCNYTRELVNRENYWIDFYRTTCVNRLPLTKEEKQKEYEIDKNNIQKFIINTITTDNAVRTVLNDIGFCPITKPKCVINNRTFKPILYKHKNLILEAIPQYIKTFNIKDSIFNIEIKPYTDIKQLYHQLKSILKIMYVELKYVNPKTKRDSDKIIIQPFNTLIRFPQKINYISKTLLNFKNQHLKCDYNITYNIDIIDDVTVDKILKKINKTFLKPPIRHNNKLFQRRLIDCKQIRQYKFKQHPVYKQHLTDVQYNRYINDDYVFNSLLEFNIDTNLITETYDKKSKKIRYFIKKTEYFKNEACDNFRLYKINLNKNTQKLKYRKYTPNNTDIKILFDELLCKSNIQVLSLF